MVEMKAKILPCVQTHKTGAFAIANKEKEKYCQQRERKTICMIIVFYTIARYFSGWIFQQTELEEKSTYLCPWKTIHFESTVYILQCFTSNQNIIFSVYGV